MDKATKMYKRALRSYQAGKIDKAIDVCERSISLSMKNSAAINLKGLLYYLKGNLDAAKGTWRLNVEVNRDAIAKRYLENCKNDDMKDAIYIAAVQAAGGLNIREAIGLLLECAGSDYNCINVYNTLAGCYIKVGEYDNAIDSIEKVLVIDKNNKSAIENKKVLAELGVVKKEYNYRMLMSAAGCFLLIISSLAYFGAIKFKDRTTKINEKKLTEKSTVKKEVKPEQTQKTETAKAPVVQQFPYEEINKYINEKNFDQLYDITVKWRNQNLSINEKTLMAKADELLKTSGVGYFYKKGMENANKKDYEGASAYFYKAYAVGAQSDLYSEITYMLAVSLQNKGDVEKAITYFEEYAVKYPKSNYEEEVLYRLALIYKALDINKAKTYGERLVKTYPKSIYNNSNIKEILNAK